MKHKPLTIEFCPRSGIYVASGDYAGRPYVAEGRTPEEAKEQAKLLVAERQEVAA